MGDSGDADGGGSKGTGRNYPGVGGVFMRGWQVGCIATDLEVAKGVQNLHRPL